MMADKAHTNDGRFCSVVDYGLKRLSHAQAKPEDARQNGSKTREDVPGPPDRRVLLRG